MATEHIYKYKKEGEQLQRLRVLANLTQQELAQKIGLSPSMVCSLELGTTKPSNKTKEVLGQVLGQEAVMRISWPRAYSPDRYNQVGNLPLDRPLTVAQLKELAQTQGVGAVLKTLRLMLPEQPTQAELANQAGLSVDTYRYLEGRGGQKGHNTRPRKADVEKLAGVFGQIIFDLLGFEGSNNIQNSRMDGLLNNEIVVVRPANILLDEAASDSAPPVTKLKAHRKKLSFSTFTDSEHWESEPGNFSLRLRQFRYSLPGRPTQREMADLLKLGLNTYRYLEGKSATKYCKRLQPHITQRLLNTFGEQALQGFFASQTKALEPSQN